MPPVISWVRLRCGFQDEISPQPVRTSKRGVRRNHFDWGGAFSGHHPYMWGENWLQHEAGIRVLPGKCSSPA